MLCEVLNLTNLAYARNGETISVTVVGSPGTADEEQNTVTLAGDTEYTLSWGQPHTDFRVGSTWSPAHR